MNCTWCEEPVLVNEQHPSFMQPTHLECGFRSIAGSVAHLQKRCSCYIQGAEETDPPGVSKREAARMALEFYRTTEFKFRDVEWKDYNGSC